MSSAPPDTLRVHTADNISLGYRLAGVGSRLAAQLVDNLLALPLTGLALLAYLGVAGSLVTSGEGAVFAAYGAGFFAGFVYFGYFLVAEATGGGRTPGKGAVGLRVIRLDGGAADLRSIAIRDLVRVVDSILGLGLIVMFFHPQSRRLGDIAGGTIVVHERSALSLAAATAPPPLILRTPDAGPAIDGIERLGELEHNALRVFLSRGGLAPQLRGKLAAELSQRLLQRLGLPPGAPERMWPPELFLERLYLQLDARRR